MLLCGLLFLLPLFLQNAAALQRDEDLMSFVTLPHIRALKFDVHYQDRDRVSPGYWFVAPYGQVDPEAPSHRFQQYQIGPYIYDGDGGLVWAGSFMFDNRNVFDFKAVHSIGREPHLSLVWQSSWDGIDSGHGVILKNNYEITNQLPFRPELGAFDIHEFNILNDGKSGLAITYRERETGMEDLARPDERTAILSGGFVELDINTAETTFEWDSFQNVPLSESNRYGFNSKPEGRPGWDYVHANAVDKNEDGDFIVSFRFTNTIYMISGKDGVIMWRLGGSRSDFVQDFTFSKQHDAKFVKSNGTHHTISFLNNASDELTNDEAVSSALIVELDTAAVPKTAKVLRRYNRPDGGLTRLRGNAQLLPNDNMFIGWSERGYISEHAPDSKVLLTAMFNSTRFSTYRAYKFEFTGRPSSPPDLVVSVAGTDESHMLTTFYVSWNGATDIAGWNFYARTAEHAPPVFVGNTTKSDFETMYVAPGYLDWVSAEAFDHHGMVLGTSQVHRSRVPSNWAATGFKGEVAELKPQDPTVVVSATVDDSDDTAPAAGVGNSTASGDAKLDSSVSSNSGMVAVDATAAEALRTAQDTYELVRDIGALISFVVIVCVIAGIVAGIYTLVRRRKRTMYQHIPTEEGLPEEQIRRRSTHE
ncbi:uncharacterized protein ACLA_085460 [Aspergillus clavatus NRRL 1]|uniref:ASST-domain-containing protein n=1 Tax=Aspergillus clavatus (strain ATCC 1007 / CBS 513.65 / DSM 816 / NCTC 3887 / NRRL 1 / QM 1276 / 107) TaxID=344612 RepID=A1CU64_ASPCL|nr:uncharacterized protein ACLA_085460 [Aspergillus clavatus NRRL 1]EAW06851.1 conserved hypothetical protein [Aspergillus clavatus NRRL 1]